MMQLNPRTYQQKAISALDKGFKSADRDQLLMACGTSKTLTTYWIKEQLNAQCAIFLVPCLSLITQEAKEWQSAAAQELNFLSIPSI
jgi:predicted helicase